MGSKRDLPWARDPSVEFRKAIPKDAEAILALHKRWIKSPAVLLLGDDVIGYILEGLLSSSYSASYVAVVSGRVVGFLLVCKDYPRFVKSLLTPRFLLLVCRRFLQQPEILCLASNLCLLIKERKVSHIRAREMGLVVDREYQGKGIARVLNELWISEFREEGREDIVRVYVPVSKRGVVSFMKRFWDVEWYGTVSLHGELNHLFTLRGR